ncbi:MAG: NADH-quinone oxidoreductase subunit K [Candidatus Eisenbacteria bacterium]|nr:hydrogenase [Candidatus Eisenbacteria bacterium]
MNAWIDAAVALVVFTNLRLLGTSRLVACIRIVTIQGVLLGLLPILSHAGDLTLRVTLQAAASILTKGVVFPWLLTRAVRGADVRREIDPIVGYTPSLLLGGALLGVSLWLGWRLPLPVPSGSTFLIAVSLFTIMVGLFILIARRMAITQVLGYLAMENGIYAFGLAFAEKEPLLVEMGILLDAFMAVFVMGIMIYHINREFHDIDTDRLSELRG